MKLLVDNQLPVALARFLSDKGIPCQHVQDLGMEMASDREIWDYARNRHIAIVTKDEDFLQMADYQGSIPPQVIWVRLGNCRKSVLFSVFGTLLPNIRTLLDSGEHIIEIR